jgi:N-methylhydantoinase B
VPERITASYYAMSNVYILAGSSGNDDRGWILFDIEVGGGGGRHAKDGIDCYSQGIHNLANTPIEVIEMTYPLRFKRYEFLPNSCGSGKYRGGLGVRRDIEFLDESGSLNTQFDKFKIAPFGLFGGSDGAVGKLMLNPEGPNVEHLRSKTIDCKLKRGDVISMCTQGGGGYGPAEERDPAAIERDLREGKITPSEASDSYGIEGSR